RVRHPPARRQHRRHPQPVEPRPDPARSVPPGQRRLHQPPGRHPMTTPTTPTPAKNGVETLTDVLLVSIVLSVGLMAGAASFNHVHDWTMHNSPTGTHGWFGWANAVITELIPTAALIIIARRRRHGGPIAYPMFLLVIAVGLSLTAQLAVARPSVFGWM